MSDTVKCEACGKSGRRPRMRLAPRDWFYLETHLEEENDDCVTWACSRNCADSLWKAGPGPHQGQVVPEPPTENVDILFHRLWTTAVGTPGYDKSQWMALDRAIHKLIYGTPK